MSIAERFMKLFRGNDRAHGVFNIGGTERERDGKKQGAARIIKEPTTLQMWEEHLEGKNGLGIIPIKDNNRCHWGSIDIDQYDLDHGKLIKKLRKLQIPALVGRSKSGGGHLYFFFAEEIEAADLQSKLKEIAALLGYGGHEVFPKQSHILVERGDTGNFLNMPYFGGDRTVRYVFNDAGESMSMEEFLDFAEGYAIEPNGFLELKTKRENKGGPLPDGPPCLQHLCAQGFGEGSRNNALFNLGVYARMAEPENWEAVLTNYNLEHMKPPLSHSEVGAIVKQLQKKDYFYKCNDQPIKSFCNKELCLGRKYGVGTGASSELSNLIKIDGDPPIWIMSVDGERVELDTDSLNSQARFKKACLEQINKMPQKVTDKVWEQNLKKLLENLTVVEVPPEATHTGEFERHLTDFCCERARGDIREDILNGVSVWMDGRVFFQVKDLRMHLEYNGFEHFTSNKIALHLKDVLKAEPMFWRVREKGVHVYSLPQEFFNRAKADILPFKRKTDII